MCSCSYINRVVYKTKYKNKFPHNTFYESILSPLMFQTIRQTAFLKPVEVLDQSIGKVIIKIKFVYDIGPLQYYIFKLRILTGSHDQDSYMDWGIKY